MPTEIRAPRYTSYPPATVFAAAPDPSAYRAALAGLDPATPVSLYVHIPFCSRLCWFCACRTQGVRSLGPVAAYLDTLSRELALLAEVLPARIPAARLHLGGGTPTILTPEMIARLVRDLSEVFDLGALTEFSVEIDPTLVDEAKVDALSEAGMTRASIGVQDFSPEVQAAIGRDQSFEITQDCVRMLRAAGIGSLNLDLVYGLPFQTKARMADTIGMTLDLDPDRIALFGYAHVPHLAKRQQLIPEHELPDDVDRAALYLRAGARFIDAGLKPVGIDHFARAGDSLLTAATTGSLRRNFQGYTDDTCDALIGIGASAISRIGGLFQNAPVTADYSRAIAAERLATARQHVWAGEDALRARAIEMLMCDFAIDLGELTAAFGSLGTLARDLIETARAEPEACTLSPGRFRVKPGAQSRVRLIAQRLDQYDVPAARYSRVS